MIVFNRLVATDNDCIVKASFIYSAMPENSLFTIYIVE